MALIAICVVGYCTLIFLIVRRKRLREQRELELHSIEPRALHALLAANEEILVVDVRQPLDFLAHSEIIPGARRIPPKDLLEHPSLIPREKDAVIYCTCPSEKTSRMVLQKAQAMQFTRIRFLTGGLAGWKAMGYPVEPYDEPFHLDTVK